jgi:hypothetical protein
MTTANRVHSTPPPNSSSTPSLDKDLSKLPQREINLILEQWQRERRLGIPAQKRLQALLGVLKSERLSERNGGAA